MKKNNSFKMTFYLGLIVLLIIASISTLIIVNVFNVLSLKLSKNKPEIYINDVKPEKQIIYDTIYVDKSSVKVSDTLKNVTVVTPKSLPVIPNEKDTNNVTKPIIEDTIN
jgi:hypothetical protein